MDKKITIGQILTVIGSILIGIISVLLIQNCLGEEKIEFNTMGLLGFVLSIIFGGASIVLAITAIHLGKSSESMMVDRSEKSIELQTEIYIKTNEALKKIESSTGVTEKRIEDIIAGRVGDIANKLVDDRIVTGRDKGKLERELRKSLTGEITPEEKKIREAKRIEEEQTQEKYKEYKDSVLLTIANSNNSKTLKIGDGGFSESGEKLVDGLFEINNQKVGICTFFSAPFYEDIFGTDIDKFLNNIAEEISSGTFNKVYLAFNEESVITDRFNKEIDKIKSLYKVDISSQIELLTGNPEKVSEGVINQAP
jgi:hypothetical protein